MSFVTCLYIGLFLNPYFLILNLRLIGSYTFVRNTFGNHRL